MSTSMNSEHQSIEDQLNAIVADLTAIRTSVTTLTARLDTAIGNVNEAGTNIVAVLGTNTAAVCDPAALTSVAGT